jgi:hypothetical protein
MNFSLGYCLEAAGVIVLSLRFQLCSIFVFFFPPSELISSYCEDVNASDSNP